MFIYFRGSVNIEIPQKQTQSETRQHFSRMSTTHLPTICVSVANPYVSTVGEEMGGAIP